MQLTVTQENLARALSTVSRIASNRGSLPILSNVLLKTTNNQLFLSTTNLDIAISETIGAKVKKTGSITVPARLMQDYVSSLPPSTLQIETTNNKLKINTDHHNSTINGTPAGDFPEMPIIEKGKELVIKSEELKTTLQQVLFAASSDEARPVLTGLYLHSEDKKLIAASTDSYRLAEKTLNNQDETISLLIPANSLQEILRVMNDDTGDVLIKYDEQQARINVGSIELITRLIEGSYPKYKTLIPKDFATTAILKRSDLQEITKVSSLFAREAAGSVTVTLNSEKNEVSIKSIASQVGENNAVTSAKVKGDAVITMNSRYILDALNAFEGDKIQINVNGKLDPCVFTNPDNDDYLHIVMPVKS